MYHTYITTSDDTVVSYTDIFKNKGVDSIKVNFETPVIGGFNSADCIIPGYIWGNVKGFSREEIKRLDTFLSKHAPIIFRLARGEYD